MKPEEILWEIKSALETGSPFFNTREVEAMREACKHVERSERYRHALVMIRALSDQNADVLRIIEKEFDMEDE